MIDALDKAYTSSVRLADLEIFQSAMLLFILGMAIKIYEQLTKK